MSRLSATVLILEAIVIALTIVPAVKLEDATPISAGAGGRDRYRGRDRAGGAGPAVAAR